jgi:hypothetical protein
MRAWPAVLGLGIVASQAGHLLTYQVLFGSAAQYVQSSGAHAYFPALAKTWLGASAAVLLGGLLLVGLARVLSGRPAPSASAPSYLRLLALLFTIQLAMFGVQETAESVVSGSRAGSVDVLLLTGTLGQLPVAAVASLALRWLLVRVGPALTAVRSVLTLAQQPRPMAAALISVPAIAYESVLLQPVVAGTIRQRGPPSS